MSEKWGVFGFNVRDLVSFHFMKMLKNVTAFIHDNFNILSIMSTLWFNSGQRFPKIETEGSQSMIKWKSISSNVSVSILTLIKQYTVHDVNVAF